MDRPTYQPSTPCGPNDIHWDGFSWTRTLVTGDTIGVLLKLRLPCIVMNIEKEGFSSG